MDSAQVADAINQFHKHITYYKTFVQEPDVEFQHWAWIGNQYVLATNVFFFNLFRFEAFGSLMVIYQAAQIQLQQIQQQNQPASPQVTSSPVPPAQQNLPTSPQNMSQSSLPHGYWHPGFYYQSASSYQILRRKSFERIFQVTIKQVLLTNFLFSNTKTTPDCRKFVAGLPEILLGQFSSQKSNRT
jgi:hypothetical protein